MHGRVNTNWDLAALLQQVWICYWNKSTSLWLRACMRTLQSVLLCQQLEPWNACGQGRRDSYHKAGLCWEAILYKGKTCEMHCHGHKDNQQIWRTTGNKVRSWLTISSHPTSVSWQESNVIPSQSSWGNWGSGRCSEGSTILTASEQYDRMWPWTWAFWLHLAVLYQGDSAYALK